MDNDFALAIAFGILGAILGWIVMAIFRFCDRAFSHIPAPIYFRTTLAGLGLFC